MASAMEPVLIRGEWRQAERVGTFRAVNPVTIEPLSHEYPVRTWADCDAALTAAATAATDIENLSPTVLADFLEDDARRLDAHAVAICEQASLETTLAVKPRLLDVEMPRTTRQLRLAAEAARAGSWRLATVDTANNFRSCYVALGPVVIFGPINFPLAFNGISGGDFAAAIATGNPVIAKANPSHPRTTQLMAGHALEAATEVGLPKGTLQLHYRTSKDDGIRLVKDPRVGAVAFTGSRAAGLSLKAAADDVGIPIYVELSSVNPVFLLPGAVQQRQSELVDELSGRCPLGTGQFCTCPNLFVLIAGESADAFLGELKAQFESRPAGFLLSRRVMETLHRSIKALCDGGG
jgi:2,5-dioxopentanoate dehydrogenase